ncbi:MAG: exopolysaccharide biosynthesis polyprenyl glycosylphosphotransferase [Hyphomicrobiaceae bacterium]
MNNLTVARSLGSQPGKTHRAEWLGLNSLGFTAFAVFLDAAVIITAAVVTGIAYHYAVYEKIGVLENYFSIGVLTAVIYIAPFLFRDEYRVQSIIGKKRTVANAFVVWNYAFLFLAAIGFLTKSTEIFSRGGMVLFYFAGLASVVVMLLGLRVIVARAVEMGLLSRRRLMLIGSDTEISNMKERISSNYREFEVVDTIELPEDLLPDDILSKRLVSGVVKARNAYVDDVVMLVDWHHPEQINAVIEAFGALPVGLHLGASQLMARFSDAKVVRFGSAAALSLSEPPLAPLQAFTKRNFDIVVASIALILLSPLFVLIAALIKWDSKGPVFFHQRRTGFNMREFRIWKFRTMSTMDDGDVIVQAKENDARISRVGHYLRRFNLDELPQLINVIVGDMSLVGPRPHAVAHDRHYEERIGVYIRRMKMRPGITGWAQVNGYRGATNTEAQMRDRVAHDLHYIDNWSLALDIYILLLTVISPKAYRNAN